MLDSLDPGLMHAAAQPPPTVALQLPLAGYLPHDSGIG